MLRVRHRPDAEDTMRITTYTELRQYLTAFKHGHISLLVIRSTGGLGKTYESTRQLPEALVFKGHATPLSIYMDCAKQPHKRVIFDDVDTLVDNKTNVALLKQLCELQEDKPVHYSTTYRVNDADVPRSFVSNNKVLLLCNDILKVGKNMGALLTRGFFIDFVPTPSEVIAQLREFDGVVTEVVDYMNEHRDTLDVNYRTYEKCVEIMDSSRLTGLSWKEWLRGEFSLDRDEEIAKELEQSSLSREEIDLEWTTRTGKSTRTYYRVVRKLREEERL
jgi:hypothetical protein